MNGHPQYMNIMTANEGKDKTTSKRKYEFPFKLYTMLQDMDEQGTRNVISWLPDGKSFRILNADVLATKILPKYFSEGIQYKSFIRNINLYRFERIRDPNHPERSAYWHPLFRRGCLDMCLQMVRPKRPRNDVKQSKKAIMNMKSASTGSLFVSRQGYMRPSSVMNEMTTVSELEPGMLSRGNSMANTSTLPVAISWNGGGNANSVQNMMMYTNSGMLQHHHHHQPRPSQSMKMSNHQFAPTSSSKLGQGLASQLLKDLNHRQPQQAQRRLGRCSATGVKPMMRSYKSTGVVNRSTSLALDMGSNPSTTSISSKTSQRRYPLNNTASSNNGLVSFLKNSHMLRKNKGGNAVWPTSTTTNPNGTMNTPSIANEGMSQTPISLGNKMRALHDQTQQSNTGSIGDAKWMANAMDDYTLWEKLDGGQGMATPTPTPNNNNVPSKRRTTTTNTWQTNLDCDPIPLSITPDLEEPNQQQQQQSNNRNMELFSDYNTTTHTHTNTNTNVGGNRDDEDISVFNGLDDISLPESIQDGNSLSNNNAPTCFSPLLGPMGPPSDIFLE